MIPLKLQLKNFLSYGPVSQTINFEPYDFICLSGKNGHGKSALLEAITWVLWGHARKTSGVAKADAQLLHLGQTHMLVIFDFSFNNEIYRVRREYTKAYGKTVATLDFGIVHPVTQLFSSLTTNALRTTQESIIETLGLDYDAFINTAFLRQGNSNEFSKKSPKERKEVLGSILGLHHYDRIRLHTLEKIKKLQEKITLSRLILQKLESESAQLHSIVAHHESLEKHYRSLCQAENELQQHGDSLRNKETELLTIKTHHEQAIATLKKLEPQYNRQRLHVFEERKTLLKARHQSMLSPLDLARLEQEFNEYTSRLNRYQAACQQTMALKQALIDQTQQQQNIYTQLHAQHQQILQNFTASLHASEIQHQVAEHAFQTITHHLQQEETALEQFKRASSSSQFSLTEASIAKKIAHYEKHQKFYHEWAAQAQQLASRYNQACQMNKLTTSFNNQHCPLCEQDLSIAQKDLLQQKYLEEQKNLEHRLRRLKRVLPILKEVLTQYHQEVETLKQQYQEQEITRVHLKQREISCSNLIKQLQQDQGHKKDECILLNKKIETIKQQAEAQEAAHNQSLTLHPELKAYAHTINEIKHQLEKLAHNEEEHEACRIQHEQLSHQYKIALSRVHEKIRYHEQRSLLLIKLRKLQEQKKELRHLKIIEGRVQDTLQQLSNLYQTKNSITQELQVLQKTKNESIQERAKIAHAQQRLEHLQQEVITQHEIASATTKQIEDYTIIASALGKDGIQALLIEDAIPEIEHEANALLAQLTDNQTHLFIDSLRDLKRGGSRETLDIKISDAVGIRPYELFSGGEAFRIDFALRIAVSKLLARRAGTSLQTLIIDEGFGSQDEDGLSHIMDALHRIRDNFCKVIIVSHLSTMKDQFPVQFIVQKNPHGSTVQVVQQG